MTFYQYILLQLRCISGTERIFGSLQREITEGMRAILVDWLIDVTDEYLIQTSTLFLTVHLIDKVICRIPVQKNRFQLIGCACLLIASKMEEVQVIC